MTKCEYFTNAAVDLSEKDFRSIYLYFRKILPPNNKRFKFPNLIVGMLIEGGLARNVALELISMIPSKKIPGTMDLDIVTIFRPRVYENDNPIHSRRQVIPSQGESLGEALSGYFRRKMFTLDGVFLGKWISEGSVDLFATPEAVDAYTQKIIKFSDNYPGIVWDGKRYHYIAPRITLRYFLLETLLEPLGFKVVSELDFKLAKTCFHRGLREDPWVRINLNDYSRRSKNLGVYPEFKEKMARIGITI